MQRWFETKGSFEIRDEASHARRVGWRRFPSESGLDGFVEFVGGGGGTGVSDVLVQVIDPAVVEQAVINVEYGHFRSDLDVSLIDKRVLRIAQRSELVA